MRTPWAFVGYLAWEFDLNRAETADLAQWAETLADIGLRALPNLTEAGVLEQLEVRASVLAMAGTPFQEIFNDMDRRGIDGPYTLWDKDGPMDDGARLV